MIDMSQAIISIPEGHVFRVGDGEPFTLDIVEALVNLNQIYAERKPDGDPKFEHLGKFQNWLKAKTGRDFTIGQADRIAGYCQSEYMRQKRELRQLVQAEDTSPREAAPLADELDIPDGVR